MKCFRFFILAFLLAAPFIASAQYHDNIWLAGYGGGSQSPGDTTFGISILDFTDGSLSIENNQVIEMNFQDTNAGICDEQGNLLFYFNGIYIEDASFQTMENGEELNEWNLGGYDLPQGGLILPSPGDENQYFLLHSEEGYIDYPGWYLEVVGLYYSIVDMQENNGLGAVVLKKEPLIIDTLEYGKITATKHANGRDWWILMNESHSNRYYKMLLDDNGLSVVDAQEIGLPTIQGDGQSVFSPDGTKYVMFNTVDLTQGQFIEIYDFDRCTGYLDNHRRIQYDEDAYAGGVAISPNSRFLYVSSYTKIYQFDLWEADIEASKKTVAEYDGFVSPLPTRFYQAQLAADGKIYITCTNSVNILHVIHSPNLEGLACRVEQHGIQLPTYNSFAAPNFPNYRLGPIDGSPCDTLGIDNIPLAGFRCEVDTVCPLVVYFTDLSHYEPLSWWWEFGDGNTSPEVNPAYEFPAPGVYEVCLTVVNQYGSDTKCKEINLSVTSTEGLSNRLEKIEVYPNPASGQVELSFFKNIPMAGAKIRVFDISGNPVFQKEIKGVQVNLDLSHLPSGIYLVSLQSDRQVVNKKLILHK